jgi:hypothetical protein
MLCTFQHPPGAEARSFIASREATLDTSGEQGSSVSALPSRDGGVRIGKAVKVTDA